MSARSPQVILFHPFWNRTLRISGIGTSPVRCPSCHPTISAKALGQHKTLTLTTGVAHWLICLHPQLDSRWTTTCSRYTGSPKTVPWMNWEIHRIIFKVTFNDRHKWTMITGKPCFIVNLQNGAAHCSCIATTLRRCFQFPRVTDPTCMTGGEASLSRRK